MMNIFSLRFVPVKGLSGQFLDLGLLRFVRSPIPLQIIIFPVLSPRKTSAGQGDYNTVVNPRSTNQFQEELRSLRVQFESLFFVAAAIFLESLIQQVLRSVCIQLT